MKHFCKFRVREFIGDVSGANFFNQSLRQSSLFPFAGIKLSGQILQVLDSIIQSVSVFMVDFFPFRAWAEKCQCDKTMGVKKRFMAFFIKSDNPIAIFCSSWRKNLPSIFSIMRIFLPGDYIVGCSINTSNPTQIGGHIVRIIGDVFPVFHVNYYTTRSIRYQWGKAR